MKKILFSALLAAVIYGPAHANHGPMDLNDCTVRSMQEARSCFRQIRQHAQRHGKACRRICRAGKQQSLASCSSVSPPILGCARQARREFRDCKRICRGR